MNEPNNLASFVNDYRSFTSIQQVPDYRHTLVNATNLADVGSIVSVTCSAIAITFAIKKTLGSRKFKTERARFQKQPLLVQAAVAGALFIAVVNGSLKPNPDTLQLPAAPPPIVRVMDATQGVPLSDPLAFTENQILAGFALSAVVTNETFDLSAPSNATIHANWRKRGAAEDGFWSPGDTFCLGTNHYDAVYVSSSGTLSFNRPKSSPSARLMPDGSSIAFLAPLQTVLGIPPEANWTLISTTNALFWHDVTDSGSARFTWRNALLGRESSAPLSFQAELFPDGDFIYRYDFSSMTNFGSRLADSQYVIGAQTGCGTAVGGGETALISAEGFRCTDANHLCASVYSLDGTNVLSTPLCSVVTNSPRFSLHWTDISALDPAVSDHDGDGLYSALEVLVHHTDPCNPDTDGDGLSDDVEILSWTGSGGLHPWNPDSDGDGLPDGDDPSPLVWDDAESDANQDGLTLADALLNNLNPAANNALDTDNDGWPDWKEALAGTSPADASDRPVNSDGSTKVFDVTVSSSTALAAPVLVAVGDHRMVFSSAPATRTVTLQEGVPYPVNLFASADASLSLTATVGSDYAVFREPHAVFQGGGALSGERWVESGFVAQPVLDTNPERICFHAKADKSVTASVQPDLLSGSWMWWKDAWPGQGSGSETVLSYDAVDYPTSVGFAFQTDGAIQSREIWRNVTRCALLDEHPELLDPDYDPNEKDEEANGETWLTRGNGDEATGLLVPVNNDDDDASGSDDINDEDLSDSDNDLVAFFPLGLFTGLCCPCSEHQPKYGASTATLLSASSKLALWADACKSNAFMGTVNAGEAVYVEGLGKSTSVDAEELVWEYTQDSDTHTFTNSFSVLSQRIFADLDSDGDVGDDDKALHPSLSSEFGWVLPVATNAFRKAQLRTDVGVPGIHTLILSGDACRVWKSGNPSTNDTPLLVSGQTVTNGVDGVSWGTSSTANLYIQAVTNGTATLTYVFHGTGSASGIVSRASMKMTIIKVDLERNGQVITDTTTDVMVGEKIDLTTEISPSGLALDSQEWIIPATAVKSYSQTISASASEGKKTDLAQTDLKADNIAFYWIDAGDSREVEYTVEIGGATCTGKATFNVKRPAVTLTSATTTEQPPVGVRDLGAGQELVFGSFTSPGITWTAEATTSANGAGSLAFVQLINTDLRTTLADASKYKTTPAGVYILDPDENGGIRPGGTTAIGNSDTKTHEHADVPGSHLEILDPQFQQAFGSEMKTHTRSDQFMLYLMYKPSTADSIWVTLRLLQWHWSGGATKNLQTGVWSLDAGGNSSQNPGSSDSTTLPEWNARMPVGWIPDN